MRWGRKAEAVKDTIEAKSAVIADAFRQVTHGDLEKARASLTAGGIGVPQAFADRRSLGALAVAATAFGVVAIGAFAIGRLSVGRMRVGQAEIGRLRIGELEVGSILAPAVASYRARRPALLDEE